MKNYLKSTEWSRRNGLFWMRYVLALSAWKDVARFPLAKFDMVLVAEATATLYSER